ncbi:MAG: RluA family pseudouridine synthase [Burkholderiaceae bacterium]
MGAALLKESVLIISGDPSITDSDDGLLPETGTDTRSFEVQASQHGQRLDRVLAAAVPEFSRSYLQQLMGVGAVLCNGVAAVRPALRVRAGDTCRVELRPTPQSSAFVAQAMDLQVVHEDAHLLVIEKPAGLVVHPAPGNWGGTLLNGLLAYDAVFAHLPRAGIVHRLDKNTSGLLLVARSRQAMDALVAMIAARSVQRQYLALAHGPWNGPALRDIQNAIGRDPAHRLRMAVLDAARHVAKPARTTVELQDTSDEACLVRCSLHTGRTHQIRVHMAAIGHPLLGDATYGGRPMAGLQRQALHAFRLALPHPVSGIPHEFVSRPPPDLELAIGQCGLRYNLD